MGFVVAIDGPAGSGKGTVTKLVAEKRNLVSIDTGAMYRCVALYIYRNNIDLQDIDRIKGSLDEIDIEFKFIEKGSKIYLNGEDVSKEIRKEEISLLVSPASKIQCIRDKITIMERKIAQDKDVIMEGRDIGTVVFPNADVKIYLDATPEERAKRRYNQNVANGIDGGSYEEILNNIIERDYRDSHREIAPLKKAEDATYLDSTNLTIDEVVEKIIKLIDSKRGIV